MKRTFFALTPVALACKCALAQTLPTGGIIVQGQGSIGAGGNTMVVTQASQRMIADWQSFSIGSGNTVRFVQPSADAVALNRVVGTDPSRIFGNLTANGRVYLQNPNGVLFARGAQVSVGSLVATTLQADTAQFMATGTLQLSGAEGAGSVSNEGTINVAPGGYAVLAAPHVNNSGIINASGGTIALAAGGAVSVDPTGAGVVTISVPVAAVGAELVNSGTLAADGGRISLQAAASNAAASRVLQVDGVVRARSIQQQGGEIVLAGGTSGTVAVGGTLDVSGDGALGGEVRVLGQHVLLEGTADIGAGGTNGGGTVLVGGALHGQGSDANALTTTVEEGARIDASARGHGNGGDVVVWSDDVTTYAGSITARGGSGGGDGGQVEVSGKQLLRFTGDVDTSAPAGKTGTLLLDPAKLDIGSTADVNGDGTPGDDLTGTPLNYGDDGVESWITAARVAQLLYTSDVLLQASNTLTVSAPLTVSRGGANSTLTLNSPVVNINAPVLLHNTSLDIDTRLDGSDAIYITAPIKSLHSIALTSTDIDMYSATDTATWPDIRTPSLTMSAPQTAHFAQISQTAGSISADSVTIAESQGYVSLPSAANSINRLDVNASDVTVTVGSTPSGAPLSLGATTSGDFTLTVGGGLVQSRSLTVGGLFTVTTGGDAVLDNTANDFQGAVRFDIGGSLRLSDSNDLDAGGTAATGITIDAGGLFTLGADISSTGTSNPSLIQISSAGFDNSSNSLLNVQPGGRFIIRSSDFEHDVIGAIGFSADGSANINYTVLNGWTGPDPTTGNGYYTNRTGTLDAPNADRPPISFVYDRMAGFDYTQTGDSAQALLQSGSAGGAGLSRYTVSSTGAFADPNAGTNKTYTVAASHDVVATVAGDGSTLYGLLYNSFTRPAGVVGADGPGNAISEITPRPVTGNGVEGVDRVYDGTNTVMLNVDGATLSGVLPGDSVGLAAGNPVGIMADKNVGIDKPVTAHGALVLDGLDAGNYMLIDDSTPTVTITARGLTPTGIGTVDRYVNGTTNVALTTGAVNAMGIVSGDDVGINAAHALGSVATPDAGDHKPTTVTGLSLTGADAGNYQIVSQPVNADGSGLTVNILPLPVITQPPPPPPPPPPHPPSSPSLVSSQGSSPPPASPVTIPSDPAQAFRQEIASARRSIPPADVDLAVGSLAVPAPAQRVAFAVPCPPAMEQVTDTRTYFFYFPYRSAAIDLRRSASEQSSLLHDLEEGFHVERVRGFTSPEGGHLARYDFEGNDELSHRRALATVARLHEVCAARGEDCVPDSVQAEAGSELHALIEPDSRGRLREAEGERLAEYAAAAFSADEIDARQRTPEIQRELEEAHTSEEKAQVVYPRLRRAQVDLVRQREAERPLVAPAAGCSLDHTTASNIASVR